MTQTSPKGTTKAICSHRDAETDLVQCKQQQVLRCVAGIYLLKMEQCSPAPEKEILSKVAFLL